MKESFHICFTSHDEVMFRDEDDHGMFVNLMALRAFSNEVEVLADAEMSTHVHADVFTNCPDIFAGQLRMSYTKYFNHKYDRKGRFGQKYTFTLRIEGFYHQMVALNYILRNGLHHGAASTAFGYPYCSIRDMFAQDICIGINQGAIRTREDIASYLPRYSEFPDNWMMNEHGVFTRQSFMELRRAEQYYGSPRNYLYQMNRLTDETWKQEQLRDNTGSPITIGDIEQADADSVSRMLNNEHGRNFSRTRMQDMDVCRLIDKELLPARGVPSVYLLTSSQKQSIARQLSYEWRLPNHQIRRCLVF